MKKLFKKSIASILATAIAMSSMIISASAEFSIGSATSDTITAGATKTLALSGAAGAVTATSSDNKVATVVVTGSSAIITGVAAGTAKITITDAGAKADDKTDDVPKEFTVTVNPKALTLYTDSGKATQATSTTSTLVAYINGYKQKTPVVDYKTTTIYTPGAATGKYVVALSTSTTAPAVTAGKPAVDTAAAEIAKATIKDNNVIVTANKKAGDVYVYVYDIKDGKVVSQSAAAKVIVKTAANIVGTYKTTDIEASKPKTNAKAIKTGVVPSGSTASFAAYGDVKDKTVAITDNKFVVSIPEKSRSLIQVQTGGSDGSATYGNSVEIDNGATFTVKAASLKADTKNPLKVKTANATVEIMNKQSGKKTSLKIVIVNSLTTVKNGGNESGIKDGYASKIDEKGDVSKYDVVFGLDDSNVGTTDKVTVAVLGKQAAFDTTKGKQTEKASKLYAAKLQQTDKGTFRARITAKANVKSDATETAYVYIITTDAAKNVTYHEVATINAKTGEVTKATTVKVYVNGKLQTS